MKRLRDQVGVITGGGSGIGLAAVRKFVAEGAEVEVWDRAEERSTEALADVEHVRVLGIDVRYRDAVRDAAQELHKRAGRIDFLINNAGLTVGHVDTLSLEPKVWRWILQTNLEGTLNCVQAILPAMKERGAGSIVNVTSVLARHGFPGQVAYTASKSGIEGLTRVWARELGGFGIRVNAVSPGYIVTPMNAKNSPGLVQVVLERTPLGRLGRPEEVADVYLFLCSEEASFVHGTVLEVDGGLIP